MTLAAALAVLLVSGARAQVPAPPAAATAPRPADFDRFSVLTSPGPDEPPPELMAHSKRLLYAVHRVQRGETNAAAIAKEYGTTLGAVQATNNNEYVLLYPGMPMLVTNRDGLLYQVRRSSETLDQIAARWKAGKEARDQFKEQIVRANNLPGAALLGPYVLERGDRILLPGVRVNFDTYRIPVSYEGHLRISSPFGSRFHPILKRVREHDGVDIPKPYGTPVYPARSGRVVAAGWHEGYGQLIEIRHANGETTRYGHLSKTLVHVGQLVQRDRTMIGRVGSTGISTGPHLHFEVRDKNGKPVNPMATIGQSSTAAAKRGKKKAKK